MSDWSSDVCSSDLPELRFGLVFGHGEHFTAGLDLPQWAPVLARGEWIALPDGCIEPFGLDESKRLRKPMVVAARGVSFTVAVELMLAADIRVAGTDARFGQLEVQRGFFPCGGATVRLAQEEIGKASCRDSVCPYVWISVGAVSLKKKKTKKKKKNE